MSTITDYYKKSELALAAYADFAGGVTNYQAPIKGGSFALISNHHVRLPTHHYPPKCGT